MLGFGLRLGFAMVCDVSHYHRHRIDKYMGWLAGRDGRMPFFNIRILSVSVKTIRIRGSTMV